MCYNVRDSEEDSESDDTTTPLIEAALSNSEKVVTDLLKHGASVNFPKVNNKTVTAPCHNPILIATGLELSKIASCTGATKLQDLILRVGSVDKC